MKKRLIILSIFALVFLIAGTIIYVFLRGIFSPYTSPQKIKKELDKNYEMISKVVLYLKETEYETIDIQCTDYIFDDGDYGTWYVDSENDKNVRGVVPINNDDIVDIVENMSVVHKYQNINKQGNTILFQLWANLDMSSGFAYTMDGLKPQIQFVSKIEKLNKKNWYYYETDFNEWKKHNK